MKEERIKEYRYKKTPLLNWGGVLLLKMLSIERAFCVIIYVRILGYPCGLRTFFIY